MRIEIVAWDKFNPRKDVKTASWFRMENSFCTHPDFFDLTNDQKMVWVFLLCEASKKMKSTIDINPSLVGALLKVSAKTIINTLTIFASGNDPKIKILDFKKSPDNSTIESDREKQSNIQSTSATDGTGRDEQDGTNSCVPPEHLSSLGDRLPVRSLADLWNKHKHATQPAIKLDTFKPTSTRYRAARARLVDNPSLSHWEDVIKRIANSSFCRGEGPTRDGRAAWIANFDFLIKPDTGIKVLEGKYDNRIQKSLIETLREQFESGEIA